MVYAQTKVTQLKHRRKTHRQRPRWPGVCRHRNRIKSSGMLLVPLRKYFPTFRRGVMLFSFGVKHWWPRRWKQYDNSKRREMFTRWQTVTSRKTWIFSNTAVRTSNPRKPSYPGTKSWIRHIEVSVWFATSSQSCENASVCPYVTTRGSNANRSSRNLTLERFTNISQWVPILTELWQINRTLYMKTHTPFCALNREKHVFNALDFIEGEYFREEV